MIKTESERMKRNLKNNADDTKQICFEIFIIILNLRSEIKILKIGGSKGKCRNKVVSVNLKNIFQNNFR